jgi:tetratricopeptide (TPR) repeat protein
MKPFRRTQVITLMAACAISTAWGQPVATPKPMPVPAIAPGDWQPDLDRVRAQMDMAREKAAEARDILRDQIKEETIQRSMEMAQDAVRVIEGRIDSGFGGGFGAGIGIGIGDKLRLNLELAQDITPKAATAPMAPMAPMPPKAFNFSYGGSSYESGKSALDNHSYERAVEIFDKVINAKNASSRIEGAYYWKAYALNKLGKRDEALAALAELAKQFPQSSWQNDAKALQAEVRQANGQPVSPENQADEDLKLYAINALSNSDADRAVPLLEGLLGNPKMSPRLKERALFVLAQSRSDKAREIVGRYAKGGSNPDLQLTAVQYLGTYRSNESRQLLSEVYGSVSDVNVKRSVLRSFEMSRDVDHLAAIAKSEQNVDLRREAVRQLGNIREDRAVTNLVSIYGTETDRNIKSEILNSLANEGAIKPMIECARKEKDPELKRVALRRLGESKSKEAMDFIEELLK